MTVQIFELGSLTCGFTPSGKNQYRKELIPIGGPYVDSSGTQFSVSASRAQAWALKFSQMRERGIKVPGPEGHSWDASDNIAYWDHIAVERNEEKDRLSLYGYITLEGDNAKFAESDVSIYVHPRHKYGDGFELEDFVQHAAFTDYPQIPGLDGFQRIAAAQFLGEDEPMTTVQEWLEEEYGIELEEGQDPKEALDAHFASLEEANEEEEDTEGDGTVEEASAEAIAASAVTLDLARQNRQLRIDNAAREFGLTSAQVKQLKKAYCSDSLTLSAMQSDGFENTLTVLCAGPKKSPAQEKTGPQGTALSQGQGDGPSLATVIAKRMSGK